MNQTIKNTNPIVLSADGVPPPVFFNGSARMVLFTEDLVQVRVMDPLPGISTPGDAFANWDALIEYDLNQIVIGNDARYYKSIVNGNIGNDPPTSSGVWMETRFVDVWNASYTYGAGLMVTASDLNLYISLLNDNVGNDPILSPTEWQPLTGDLSGYDPTNVAISGGIINGTTIGQTFADLGSFTILDADTANFTSTLTGTLNGRDPTADGTKLDGIEALAEVNQTDAQIKVQYEANPDTNAFTDADVTKLGIAVPSDVTAIPETAVAIFNMVEMAQADYDLLAPPDANTVYFIRG